MVSFPILALSALSTLATSVSATSGCRCGDSAYLAIPRVNLSIFDQQAGACASNKLIDARGSGEPQAVSLMFQDVISRLLSNDSSTISQSITYPAGFDQNVTSGVQETVSIIKSGLEQCPDQKYHLFGYSQGATLVQSALQELEGDKQAMNAIKNVVVVGNPYRIPGRKANVDSHGHRDNRTVYGLFATQALERQANASFPAFSTALDGSGKISDICLENDIVCAHDPECDCQLASDHLSYGLMKSVQDLIFGRVVSKL